VRARLDARLFTPVRKRERFVMAVVVLSSMVVGFFLVQAMAPKRPLTSGGFELAPEARVEVTREAAVELSPATVVFDRPRGVRVTSIRRTSLRRELRGIRVLTGEAEFEVQKRSAEAGPVRVLVSGGSIEVHGTRFTVKETGAGTGSVALHEGAIDFLDEAGVTHVLRPGETLQWPVPPPAAPLIDEPAPLPQLQPVPPKEPRPATADWRLFDQRVHAEAVITELGQLRKQGAWNDAVHLLERELNRGAPDTRERLSFELGLILTWQIKDTASACAHWAQHQREYPEGRFDGEVDRAAASLGCPP
jgi:transmembrane sensor